MIIIEIQYKGRSKGVQRVPWNPLFASGGPLTSLLKAGRQSRQTA